MTTDTLLVFQDGRWQDVVPGSASMSEQARQLADEFMDAYMLEGDPETMRRMFDKVLTEAHAAGVAAERARVAAVLDAENAELLEWAKESQDAGDEEGLSSFKADLGGLYLLRRKLLKDIAP